MTSGKRVRGQSRSLGPKWFWAVQIVLVVSTLFWKGPNHFGQVQIIFFWTSFYDLDPSKSNYTHLKWFGRPNIILDPLLTYLTRNAMLRCCNKKENTSSILEPRPKFLISSNQYSEITWPSCSVNGWSRFEFDQVSFIDFFGEENFSWLTSENCRQCFLSNYNVRVKI